MKKNKVKKNTEAKKLKKIQLTRETLQTLTSTETEKVVGGTTNCCSSPPGGNCG